MSQLLAYYEMANSESFLKRVTAALAFEGVENPEQRVRRSKWKIPTLAWVTAWAEANPAIPDKGADVSVISDADIRSRVQTFLANG
jgi:hypothetical protein